MKFLTLLKRNLSIFYKDKMLFFVSLITPIILIILYATFLLKVYRDTFSSAIPDGLTLDSKIIEGVIGGQMVSSLLAVIPVTTSFSSATLIVRDKVNKTIDDIMMTGVNKLQVIVSYFITTFINTMLTSLVALIAGLIYIAIVGWYITFSSIMLLLVGIIIMTLFGSLFASIINYFLKSEQQVAAFSTIVSSVYGFICGAYMPLSQFPTGLQNVIKILPGTYGTSYLRYVSMIDALNAMKEALGADDSIVNSILESVDGRMIAYDNYVSPLWCILIVAFTTIVLFSLYSLLVIFKKDKRK